MAAAAVTAAAEEVLVSNVAVRTDPYSTMVAAKRYRPVESRRVAGTVLCLHGWLDNADSFKGLAPLVAKDGWDVLSLDLPGHGLSDHTVRSYVSSFD